MKEQEGKVIIKCLPNKCNTLSYKVSVIDSRNKTVFYGCSSKCGITELKVNAYDKYEVRVESPECISPKAASRWVRLNPHETYGLYFIFNRDLFAPDYNNATFHLTDQKYMGLPILKGDLFLCQSHM